MANIFDNLKQTYLNVLKPVQQTLSNVGNNAVQSWTKAPVVGGLAGQAVNQVRQLPQQVQAIPQAVQQVPQLQIPKFQAPKMPIVGGIAGQGLSNFRQNIQSISQGRGLTNAPGLQDFYKSVLAAGQGDITGGINAGLMFAPAGVTKVSAKIAPKITPKIKPLQPLAEEARGGGKINTMTKPLAEEAKKNVIKISDLKFTRGRAGGKLNPYEVTAYKKAIREGKSLGKIILTPSGEIRDGNHRLRAIRDLGIDTIEVEKVKEFKLGIEPEITYRIKPPLLEGGGIKGKSQKVTVQTPRAGQTPQQPTVPQESIYKEQLQLPKIGGQKAVKTVGPTSPQTSEPIIPEGMKERKFIETVRESKVTKKDVAEQVKGFYTPTTNKEQIAKASYAVKTDYDFAKQRIIKEPLTAETNAMGQEIMRQAQNAGRFDEAIQMAELLARKGTEAGQTVQAFANWARLTPEGMLKYAQKEMLNANEKMGIISKVIRKGLGKEDIKFTPQDAKIITELMTKANNTADEVLRSKYIQQTFEYIGKKLPWGVSDFVDSYRYNNMLSNPLTHLRNAVNNLQQVALVKPATLMAEGRPIEAIKYEFAALKALPEAVSNFVKSFKGNQTFGKMDIVENVSQMKVVKPNRIGFLNIPSKTMEATDQFFRTLVKAGEMARGQTSEAAELTADYSLFRAGLNPKQQGFVLNKIDDVTKAVYQLRKVGLGWFIPFIRTPMNVAKQWIEYSPLGLTTIPGAGNKREQVAKTLLGSMVTMIGANIAMEGRTTWAAPTDAKAKELFYASGKKPYSIKIGDKWVPMQTFGVFSWALGLPAAVKYYNDESRTALTDNQVEKLTKSVLSLGGFWSNQTFVSGLGSFVKLAEGDMDYSLPKNVAYTIGQLKLWEGLMRYVATAIDPIYRKPRDFGQQLVADVPILTKGLEPYREPMGEPSKRNITNYVAPYGMGQVNPEYDEFFQMRNTQLQNNAVLNKQKKELENKINSTSPIGAGAAETNQFPAESMVGGSVYNSQTKSPLDLQRAKMQEDLVKQRVQMTGQPQSINGKYYYQNENGNAVAIELDKKLTEPKLTGNTELDKQKLANYSSSITSKIKDIVKLNELGQLPDSEAEKRITELQALQKAVKAKTAKPKKPKKISLKGIKPLKLTIPKSKTIKVKTIKPKKIKVYKLLKSKKLSTKIKKIKLT